MLKIKNSIIFSLIVSVVLLLFTIYFFIHHFSFLINLILVLLLLFLLIYSFFKLKDVEKQHIHQLKHYRETLEQQKFQLKIQEDEILHQIRFLKEQGKYIEGQKQELEESIRYAFRIQQAILPPMYFIDRLLAEYFILYIPKAVVSGDFYYVEQVQDYIIVAAVDCTGHGVPGAMMSVIGYDILNQAIKINQKTKPSEILNFLDIGVSDFLRQTYNESGVNDGMDVSVVSIHRFHQLVEFAGAYHEVYYTHHGKIFEIKGDKLPIGVNFDGFADTFTNHALPVSKGDMIYLFSDGYADQFGGQHNKKFKYNRLKNLLWQISSQHALEQKEILSKTFNDWKGDNEQTDDVLLIGIRI